MVVYERYHGVFVGVRAWRALSRFPHEAMFFSEFEDGRVVTVGVQGVGNVSKGHERSPFSAGTASSVSERPGIIQEFADHVNGWYDPDI